MPRYTERQEDGTYVTYSASEYRTLQTTRLRSTILIALSIVGLFALYMLWIAASNAATIKNFGLELYFKNLQYFHRDSLERLDRDKAYLFPAIVKTSSAETGEGALLALERCQFFRLKGALEPPHGVRLWKAAEVVKDGKTVSGWLYDATSHNKTTTDMAIVGMLRTLGTDLVKSTWDTHGETDRHLNDDRFMAEFKRLDYKNSDTSFFVRKNLADTIRNRIAELGSESTLIDVGHARTERSFYENVLEQTKSYTVQHHLRYGSGC